MIDTGTGFAAALVAPAYGADEAEEAIALAGGAIVARVTPDVWTGDTVMPAADILVVELPAAAADEAAVLDRLASLATGDRAIVVATEAAALDAVAAVLLPLGIVPLIDPDMAERVGAIAVAVRTGMGPRGMVRESEIERLRRYRAETARLVELLARLTRDAAESERGDRIEDRRGSFGAEPPAVTGPAADPQMIRRAIRARRLRASFFPPDLFAEPAWDMLLDLYAAALEGIRVSVSSLCIASAVAPTTALRWIQRMTDEGLLVRDPDPEDRRRAFMALSAPARAGMANYLTALERAGLALA